MGGGYWDSTSYNTYTKTTRGVTASTFATTNYSVQEMYTSRHLAPELDPKNVVRECCDSDEHPTTLPVILALDVTGSMGDAAVKVAKELNSVMTELYKDDTVRDVEFCIMGIGDLSYDHAPIQISQFESDIRIAEQLDKIYFEAGGGGNAFESYTAAWYMGVNHCKLDCWKRGQKGIIITIGDEGPNPYLPAGSLHLVTGDTIQPDTIETKDLYPLASEKYDLYHISVNDTSSSYGYHQRNYSIDEQWSKLLGEDNYFVANLNNLKTIIIDIIKQRNETTVFSSAPAITTNDNDEVTW